MRVGVDICAGTCVDVCAASSGGGPPLADDRDMSTGAIGGTSAQLASVMAAAALQENQLGLAEAQINASEAAGGGTPAVSSSAQAPGTLEVFA